MGGERTVQQVRFVLRPGAWPCGRDINSVPSRHLWLPPALEKPRVRTYALGHGISVLGHWVQATALSWLVYRLTDSVFMLGVMGFLTQIPFLLLGPFTGRIVDRMPKLPLLIAIDVALSAVSVVLALMAAFDVRNVWIYLAAGVLHGSLNALEMPTRQSLLARIVEDRALMPSALGVSATLFNAGRMVGPALAGAVLLYVSETWCFVFNAVSNLGIIAALLAMRVAPEDMRAAKARVQPGVISSLTTLWALPQVKILVPLMAVVGLFGVPYIHLMPSIAREFFKGGSSTFGLLMSAAGLGALLAAALLSMQRGTETQRGLIALAPAALGVALALFALSRVLALSMLLLVCVGAAVMCCANSANVLLQQSVGDAWRGRVIGLYAMSFQGLAPVGTLLAGALAAHIGLSVTLLINGLIIGAAGIYARRRLAEHPELFSGAATDPADDT
jgi:MFS family permease